MKEKPKFLSTLFSVLLFGGLWGIIEATLGTILHLPFFEGFGVFGKTSSIIIPMAFALMAMCYKKTQSVYAVFLMGVLAALIKLPVSFFIGFTDRIYNPMMYIVIESLLMGGALYLFKPTNVVSLKTFGAIVLANTLYQFSYVCISGWMVGANPFASMAKWEKYLLTINCVAILYTFGFGGIAYGVIKLKQHFNWDLSKVKKVVYHPAFASSVAAVAVVLTIVLR